jgi:hypothetical protein
MKIIQTESDQAEFHKLLEVAQQSALKLMQPEADKLHSVLTLIHENPTIISTRFVRELLHEILTEESPESVPESYVSTLLTLIKIHIYNNIKPKPVV